MQAGLRQRGSAKGAQRCIWRIPWSAIMLSKNVATILSVLRGAVIALLILSSCFGRAQTVLDGPFIDERWVLNAGASLLEDRGVDQVMLRNAEPIRTYALDEPAHWVKRIYLRSDGKDNPCFSERSPADSVLPLLEVVNRAIEANRVTPYADPDFRIPDPAKPTLTGSSVFLKIDFAYDTIVGDVVPHIIGFAMQEAGGRLVHFYYPELRYALVDHSVRTAIGLVTYGDFFDRFLFRPRRIERADLAGAADPVPWESCMNCHPSIEEQAEFDALTELYLLRREAEARSVIRSGQRSITLTGIARAPEKVYLEYDDHGDLAHVKVKSGPKSLMMASFAHGRPDGPYRAFYANGHLKEEGLFKYGLREGDWTSWSANGEIRSHRTYAEGRLNGTQRVYHANGTLWLEYGMRDGDYEGPHSTWYDDGTVKASGAMTDGFVSGEWDYNIRLNGTLKKFLDEHAESYELPREAWHDGVLSYHVSYTMDQGGKGCMLNRCIRWTYSNIR